MKFGQREKKNSRIDPSHEPITRQEASRAREQTVYDAGQETVAEEEQTVHETRDVQLDHVVPNAVHEDPDGAAAADEE